MNYLSSLSFTTAPHKTYDPKLIRRHKLIVRLEEQKRLAADPKFVAIERRWKKNPDGSKSIFDHYRRIKPWWVTDAIGAVVLTIRSGLRALEFEKGKAGIAVGAPEKLEGVLDTLIAATKAGELDRLLEAATTVQGRGIPKAKKAV